MAGAPNAYNDPFWTDLAGRTEQKLGLPDGLLVSVLTKGERSNADQVSEAGARTPFQIIPATRKAAIEKYKIDPYLSPENAAEVAGKLLKDSLERNNDNPVLAVSEYHGGTNRDNWGARTKAYAKRVVGMSPDHPDAANAAPAVASQAGSTFGRVSQQMGFDAPAPSAIANVLKAYQAGQMDPEEAKAFEEDVSAGRVMLPHGATLAPPTESSNVLPAGVLDAYASGQMSADEKGQLERDLKAGVVTLPPGAQLGQSSAVNQIPRDARPDGTVPPPLPIPAPQADPTLVQKIVGGGETALTLATGATTGTLGMLAGGAGGLVGNLTNERFGLLGGVEANMGKGMEAGTYMPRTEAGQDMAATAGQAMQAALPAFPLTAELGAAGRAAGAAATGARDVAASGVQRIRTAAPAIAERVQRTISRNPDPVAPTPGTRGSVGAAAVDVADQRRAAAADLPVPINLTRGQAERTFEQQRFEKEMAKDPSNGEPLRNRYAQQNDDIMKNFDAWVDQTGAEAPNLRAVGETVDKALVTKAARDKAEIRVAYKNAEKAGEMQDPVTLSALVDHLNESAPDAATAPLLDVARKRALQLGIATEADGQLVAAPVPLKAAETMRQAIGRATDYEATNIRQSAIIKGLIDSETEGAGGDAYRAARRMRENYAKQYEDRAVVASLLNNKRGMADRKVALEDVFSHSILKGSLDDVRTMRKVLQTGGADGQQAWRELQGQTVNWIKDEATKNVATDTRGNSIVSADKLNKAIRTLDADGKLDFVFGKKGAQQMRDINDLSKLVYTAPPGSVNTSNTASVLMAALAEAGVTGGMTGLPVPVLSGLRLIAVQVKNRKIQQRIEQALNHQRAPIPTPTRPPGATVH